MNIDVRVCFKVINMSTKDFFIEVGGRRRIDEVFFLSRMKGNFYQNKAFYINVLIKVFMCVT